MTLISWISNLSPQSKLGLVIVGSVCLYVVFRYFIHLANKEFKKMQEEKKSKRENWKENLKSLAS